MKTPRRVNKTKEVIDQQTAGIPVSDAKALFDAVSKDNTKTVTLGAPTKVDREAPVRSLGESEVCDNRPEIGGEPGDQYKPLPEGLVDTILDQAETAIDIDQMVDRAFEAAGLPVVTTTDHLVNQAVEQMKAEGIDFAALIEQGIAMTEQLIASIDTGNGPTIPGTIEMDIEQDDGTVKHHVFDNPERLYHVAAMAQCDALIRQYDKQKLEQATKPPVKPLRVGWFSWL